MALLDVVSLSKSFAGTSVLRDVSFQVAQSETVCLLGPSGCGKTTLLRIIAGLETADAGQVLLDGHPIDDVSPHQRGFGLMFQDYALFPHKDVAANVAFGLNMQGLPLRKVHARMLEMLDLVGLTGYERRRVYELSGGEQQRVALARSLAARPRLLMLDEPLGSLDRALREELMNELRGILRHVGVTSIYVTHDQQEAFAVADRILIMAQGRIVQQGTPQEVYRFPSSSWVARFLGFTNLVPGTVLNTESEAGPGSLSSVVIETVLGRLTVRHADPIRVGQPVMALIRPEAARLATDCPGDAGLPFEGAVRECSFRGDHYRLVVRHQSGQEMAFDVETATGCLPEPGKSIALVLRPDAMSLLTVT